MQQYAYQRTTAERLAIGLGWFSIGLGLAEVVAPRAMARLIGVPTNARTRATLRALGVREIGNGVGILSRPHRALPVWTRVGGDAIDLAFLGRSAASDFTNRRRVVAATAAVAGVTGLDIACAVRLNRDKARSPERSRYTVHVEHAITINRPLAEVYAYWRDFENLPAFMHHLESVRVTDNRRSRWRAKAPAGMVVEWEAELVGEREGEWIAWESIRGSDVQHRGSVRFEHAPGARGTEIHVQIEYAPPAGVLGKTVARLFGEEPKQQLKDDLRRFKQIMETGEIPLSEGPGLKRPAQPAADPEEIRTLAGVTE